MQFRNLEILYSDGNIEYSIIKSVEDELNIHFPKLYVELMLNHNNVSLYNNCFKYNNLYSGREEISEIGFDGFSTKNYESSQDILRQYIYDDSVYGYEYVFSFGSSANGDFICFDYRDNPQGNEPKICIVIHDEYDEQTGKMLLFPVANNFEEFLDSLKSFDEIMEKYS
ncbi:hypothetical protein A1D23_01145 [Chelonobacter oris]|uniref:SMI1/KNR4 family protein n=1 Tax=Chelonobacter oris TaxID=505317 RepID=UPI0024475DF7|nr:SMI1/KNR4 family protein [Chelonobacter oris]MDH3000467.1 hypothetical protein [Chelonobacter oris]